MVSPEQISNLSAALTAGAGAFAARAVGQAARRDAAVSRIVAVSPDPAALDALARIAAAAGPDLVDALGLLATTGITAAEVRALAAVYTPGGRRG